jgi:hypothetical protein
VDKQYNNYINDINNGVYTNNSLTLVNFDLGQIYNRLLRAEEEAVPGPRYQPHQLLLVARPLEGALARLQPSLLLVLFLAPAPGLVPLHLPRTLSAG